LILFILYGSRLRLPGRIPPGLIAVSVGAVLAAMLRALHLYNAPLPPMVAPGFYLPRAAGAFSLLIASCINNAIIEAEDFNPYAQTEGERRSS